MYLSDEDTELKQCFQIEFGCSCLSDFYPKSERNGKWNWNRGAEQMVFPEEEVNMQPACFWEGLLGLLLVLAGLCYHFTVTSHIHTQI